jgi:hypothetical protein
VRAFTARKAFQVCQNLAVQRVQSTVDTTNDVQSKLLSSVSRLESRIGGLEQIVRKILAQLAARLDITPEPDTVDISG